MQHNLASFREQLLKRRGAILAGVRPALVHADGSTQIPESADLGLDNFGLETLDLLFQLDHVNRLELGRINNALDRIDHGRYGICIRCGGEIDRQRLAALPYTDTCICCAEAAG